MDTQTKSEVDEFKLEVVLNELLTMKEMVKPYIKRIAEVEEWLKERGSFSTENFVVAVSPQSQLRAACTEVLVAKLGAKEDLMELGILKYISFLTVKVAKK